MQGKTGCIFCDEPQTELEFLKVILKDKLTVEEIINLSPSTLIKITEDDNAK